MSLRVNPNPSLNLANSLDQLNQQESTALQQLSSGQSVNEPADNPAALAALIQNHAAAGQTDQYTQSIASVQGALQTADAALNTVVTSLGQALSLATEGANGTLTATQRQSIASQVDNLQQQILLAANQSYQGSYIFGGTASTAPPFVANSASPSGVSYAGNNGVNSIELAPGQTAAINKPGDQIFNVAGADVFQALKDLSNALNANNQTAVATAATEVQNAFNAVGVQRTFYGATLQRLQTMDTFLSTEKVELSQQATQLVGADMAQVATNLSHLQVQRQALVQAESQVLGQPNLFQYMPVP